MWVLVVWAVSSAGTYYPYQTLISVSEEACRKEVRVVENMQPQIMRSFKAECFKSKYG
jgi:DNA-directed RNA polymerase alpha subunit